MATAGQLRTRPANPADLTRILQETHNEALIQNDFATRHWLKVRDEHLSLRSHLGVLPDKLSQEVMVPIGSKALMRGKMVHTNEILVCLGDGWFVKRSAKEALEICDRRIKLCENMLKDLERERDLLTNRKQIPLEQDAFGAADRNEILEPYDEEKEAKWRIEHQKREKEYRQKLSELRNKEKTVVDDEESLWKRLDDLELQEELEEELDRLHAERVELGYGDEESDEETQSEESEHIEEIEDGPNGLIKRNNPVTDPPPQSSSSEEQKRSSRRVSFADERTSRDSDSDSDSNAETLRIEFHHTPVEAEKKQNRDSDEHRIQSPADIQNYIKDMISKGGPPKSILKNKLDVGVYGDTESQRMKWLDQPDSVPIINQEMEEPVTDTLESQVLNEELIERPVVIGDVLEHGAGAELPQPESSGPNVRTSRFKAMRIAAKR